jgi:redox-sensitive bicupin YhaK (pirin superfamily)
MSYEAAEEPECKESEGSVALVIQPHEKDLGEFTVRRVLPARERRMVGPFIFFDHIGPAEFPPGKGIDVRPHPHIGISTVTYLFEGEIMHRDSLGYEQLIEARAVNLMTAGKGIVHSERAGSDLNETSRLHGIQSWMALPDGDEERDPAFQHIPADELPQIEMQGVTVRVIIGEAYGQTSPVPAYAETLYLECCMPGGTSLTLPEGNAELGAYVVSGAVTIDGQSYTEGMMAIACPGDTLKLTAGSDSTVMVMGGETIGKRTIWWNFVSSSKERIEDAKKDWKEKRFELVPGDDSFIPLPE